MIFLQAFPSLSYSNFHETWSLTQVPYSNVLIGNTDHNILDSITFLVVVHISPQGSPPLGGALVPRALPPWAEP